MTRQQLVRLKGTSSPGLEGFGIAISANPMEPETPTPAPIPIPTVWDMDTIGVILTLGGLYFYLMHHRS